MSSLLRSFSWLLPAAALLLSCSDDPAPARAESCTVTEGDDGALMLRCPDGSELALPAPEEATRCSVTDLGDGKARVHCTDGTEAIVSSGKDGRDGRDGRDGEDGEDGRDGGGAELSWIERTSCFLLDHPDRRKVVCLGGRTLELDPACELGLRTIRDLDWTLYSCPDGSEGIVDAQRDPAKMRSPQPQASWQVSCFLTEAGALQCWGNENHALMSEIPPDPLLRFSMYDGHICAIRADLSPICWGFNTSGQSDAPAHERFVQVTVGSMRSCGLRPDGTGLCWGRHPTGAELSPPAMETFVQLTAGEYDSCGLRADGSVLCWGASEGVPPEEERFLWLVSGVAHHCGLRLDGSIGCWGRNADGQTSTPEEEVFVELAAAGHSSCGLRSDGSVRCWGREVSGQLEPPEDETFLVLAGGFAHYCGLTTQGYVECWGANQFGQADAPFPAGCAPPLELDEDELAAGWSLRSWLDYTPSSLAFVGRLRDLGAPLYEWVVPSLQVPDVVVDLMETYFAVEYQGLIEVPERTIVTWRLGSDDGSRLFYEDALLIDNDGRHDFTTIEGRRHCLEPGWHPLTVEYFQHLGDYGLALEWSLNGGPFVEVGPVFH